MNTKLTLRLEERLIRNAKHYSRQRGKSLSQLVADFFRLIEGEEEAAETEISPRVRALIGSLRGIDLTEEDYRRHLEEKHL
ncbi:MAG: DUF6364 family protein [Anaerolineae bacterium]